jgi:valyl-tRNA synthetase
MGIPPSKDITLLMRCTDIPLRESIRRYEGYLQRLARVKELSFIDETARPRLSASAVVDGKELFVPLEGLIDLDVERARLQKEIDRLAGMLGGVERKLSNESFVAKAPQDVVEREREKLETFSHALEKLEKNLEMLKG